MFIVGVVAMEEMKDPTEAIREELHKKAEESREGWIMGVALLAALLAALAAISSLLAGHHANDAMLEQIQASDQWNYYQAKGIKAGVLTTRIDLMEAMGRPVDPKDRAKVDEYAKEQVEIRKVAEEKQAGSKINLHRHVVYSRAVTLFEVAIAVAAISVLTRRKSFWLVSIGFGAIGAVFLILGLFSRG